MSEGSCGRVGLGTDSVLEASVEGISVGDWDSSGFCTRGGSVEGGVTGTLSVGVFSAGLLSVGVFSTGVLSAGIFSAGLFSIGVLSTGVFCTGILSAGSVLVSAAKTDSGVA